MCNSVQLSDSKPIVIAGKFAELDQVIGVATTWDVDFQSFKEAKFMFIRLVNSISHKLTLIPIISVLMMACSSEQPIRSDQPIETTYQEKVSECSVIADRSERDRCLHGN